jgi:hypothetical protein
LSVATVATGATAQPLGEDISDDITLGLGTSSSSATLVYTGGGGTLDKNITAQSTGTNMIQNAGTGLLTLSGQLTKDGTKLTLNAGTGGITVSGPIVGPSPGSDLVVINGVTTLTNASNSYSGATYVQGNGTLVDNTSGAGGVLPNSTSLYIGGADNSTGTVDLNGNNQTVLSLNSQGTGDGANVLTNKGSNDAQLTILNGGNFAGAIKDGPTNKTSINLYGGNLTLSGSSSFTGVTAVNTGGNLIVSGSLSGTQSVNVSAGTLEVDGSINAGAAVSVDDSTLQGTGRLGAVTVSESFTGSTVAPGLVGSGTQAGGVLTVSSMTFTDGFSNFAIALGVNSAADTTQLASTGTVSLDDTPLTLTLGNAFSAATNGKTWIIVNGGATATGAGADLFTYSGVPINNGDTFNVGSYTFEALYSPAGATGDIEIELTAGGAVPEPGTWAMIFGGIGMLIGIQKLRKR